MTVAVRPFVRAVVAAELARKFDQNQPRDKAGLWSKVGSLLSTLVAADSESTPVKAGDLLGANDGRDLARQLTVEIEPKLYRRAGRQGEGPNGDERLVAIARRQGFDGKPNVVSKRRMDQLVASGHVELHRGVQAMDRPDGAVSATNVMERFRSGGYFAGYGIYGNGTYATEKRRLADKYAGSSGGVLRMALNPDAKVVDIQQLHREHTAFVDSLGADADALAIWSDPGAFAAARGYDVIRVLAPRGGTEYVVLNRTAVAVERD